METVFSIPCPKCQKRLKAESKHIGKTAKCPACGTGIKIAAPTETASPPKQKEHVNLRSLLEESPTEFPKPTRGSSIAPAFQQQAAEIESMDLDEIEAMDPPEPPALNTPGLPRKKQKIANRSVEAPVGLPMKYVFIIAGAASFLGLVIGFFAGREYIKYEIKSAFQKAGEEIAKSFEEGPGKLVDKEVPAAEIQEIGMRVFHQSGMLAAGVLDAKVDHLVMQRTILGQQDVSEDRYLIVNLRIKNMDQRKLATFREDNLFQNRFKLVDDVGNVIKIIDPGIDKIVGALKSGTDIQPGQEVGHVVAYVVPPPKTKHLYLTVDMSAFSGEGLFRVKIPANSIQGFVPQP